MDWFDAIAPCLYFVLDLIGATPPWLRHHEISIVRFHPGYREDLYFRVQADICDFFHRPCVDAFLRLLIWFCIIWLHYPDEFEA